MSDSSSGDDTPEDAELKREYATLQVKEKEWVAAQAVWKRSLTDMKLKEGVARKQNVVWRERRHHVRQMNNMAAGLEEEQARAARKETRRLTRLKEARAAQPNERPTPRRKKPPSNKKQKAVPPPAREDSVPPSGPGTPAAASIPGGLDVMWNYDASTAQGQRVPTPSASTPTCMVSARAMLRRRRSPPGHQVLKPHRSSCSCCGRWCGPAHLDSPTRAC